jgi:hypothetical protein
MVTEPATSDVYSTWRLMRHALPLKLVVCRSALASLMISHSGSQSYTMPSNFIIPTCIMHSHSDEIGGTNNEEV